MEPVRWGVISSANITTKLLAGARICPEADVVAVASRTLPVARAFADRHGIPIAHGRYEDLLADPHIEAIYVPLPNALHHEWTMRALRAGKHVLCEKPYSRDPDQVRAAFDLAAANELILSEAFMFRYNPQTVRWVELVLAGTIGELRLINASFSWPTEYSGNVRLDPELHGGALLDVGVYPVSAARLLAGEPIGYSARQVIGPTGVDVSFVGGLEFAEGVLASFDCGFHLPDRSRLELVGTEASLDVDDPWHCFRPGITLRTRTGTVRRIEVPVANSYQLELSHFSRAVRGEPNELLGGADAVGQAEAVAALHASAAEPGG